MTENIVVRPDEPTVLNVQLKPKVSARLLTQQQPREKPTLHLEFRHHNYTEMEALLKKIAQTRPDIARLYSIGRSVRGRELYVSFFSHINYFVLGI